MRRPITTLAGVLAAIELTLGGCTRRCPEPAPPRTIAAPVAAPRTAATPVVPRADPLGAAIDPALPLCDGVRVAVDQLGGIVARRQPCRGTGVLVLHSFTDKGNRVIDAWPVIVLDDGGWLMLESIWLPETKLAAETIAALEGQLVEVAGVIHDRPPGKIQNWSHLPTLAPVTAIRAIERSDAAPAR